jgi:hypothetical protein
VLLGPRAIVGRHVPLKIDPKVGVVDSAPRQASSRVIATSFGASPAKILLGLVTLFSVLLAPPSQPMPIYHAAGGGKVAPFFRFPDLQHPPQLMSYLAERNIAVFSTDIDSRDFKMHKPEEVIKFAKLKRKACFTLYRGTGPSALVHNGLSGRARLTPR